MKQALALVMFSAVLASAALSQESGMFRGNPAHSGVYNSDSVTTLKEVKWQFKTSGRILSSPAIADGLAYIGSEDRAGIGAPAGHLYAVDIGTGQQKWKFKTAGAVNSSPAVSSNVVYFGSMDGNFYAVDAQSGQLKWKFQTAGEKRFEAKGVHGFAPRTQTMPDSWDMFLSSPVVDKGLVYFGSGDGNLYALNTQTGTLKWKFATQGVVHSSPAISDGIVYFGSWDTYLYAVDAAGGKLKWKFQTGDDQKQPNQVGIQSSPAVAHGMVYFGCRDSNLYAVDTKTGSLKWKFPTNGSWVITSPAVSDNGVVFATSDSALFHVLDPQTGSPKFSLDAKTFIFSSPAIAGEMAYFGSFGGGLEAVDLRSGTLKWEFRTEASRKNGAQYLKPDGKLNMEALFLSSFYEDMILSMERLYSLGSILSSPVVHHGVILFGSTDGYLYALE
jgi:eukaryotic-like serine/threonine-protein kinase